MPIWLHSLGGQLYQKSPHFKELLANALLCNINLAKATNKVCMVENNEYEFIHTKSRHDDIIHHIKQWLNSSTHQGFKKLNLVFIIINNELKIILDMA
jgi:hypothetical protein